MKKIIILTESQIKNIVNNFVNESKEETEFTDDQKKTIRSFVSNYKGNFKDEDIHKLAERLKLEVPEVEEFIYSIARKKLNESKTTKKSSKKGFHSNIEDDTIKNNNFRKVLYTGENMQLVLMTLKPGEEIGEEVHPNIDQFFRFESGNGKCIINDTEYKLKDGDAIIIPKGSKHNIINTGKTPFKLYTIYTPPNHKDGIVFSTKEKAEKSKEKFDGSVTEQ